MTAPAPRYANQPLPTVRPTVENQRFFDPNDGEARQLIEYVYAHYANHYRVELVLLKILPDAIVCDINDREGNGSLFFSAAHSAIVRRLNKRTRHTGAMIKAGPLKIPAILDANAEIQRLAELAASPTVAIQPHSADYPGTIYTPETRKKRRTVQRPHDLNPKTYPDDEITYRIAKPLLLKHLSWAKIERAVEAAREKVEEQNRQARQASGKPYVGVDTPELTEIGVAHEESLAPPRGPRYRGAPALVETARKQERRFRRRYRVHLLALRARKTDFVWPPGTNFHHKINGFPRHQGDWLTPPPP